MSSQQIKVTIAGRVYPLTVGIQEADVILQAAQNIEEQVNLFQQNYAVKDKQDLLAMTALQTATQLLKQEHADKALQLGERLKDIDQALNNCLEDNKG
ncbi:MAG TPA: cell division protein ZapA [Luteibaculaceae bacterium]|nr:cell division protein ZapA [Luteibaculaceae bacterium]